MTNKSFCEHHLFNILNSFESRNLPLDLYLKNYFRAHRAAGSKDRRFICETIYAMIRWRGLIDHLCQKPASWENRYRLYSQYNPLDYLHDTEIPPHIRVSFPKAFFGLLEESYGTDQASALCLISNAQAPTTVRVNTLKTTRADLLEKWQAHYEVSPTAQAPHGITFRKKENFFGMPEFKEGLFEVQDEGSQLLADLVGAKPKQQILDFCAGSGGKTLAFAPAMQGKGQIYLHDIRSHALKEAKKRLCRAGIQNAQLLFSEDPKKEHLKQKMDTVLVDAPCSGSGTLRRNPDMKWKFDPATLDRLVLEQRSIFEEALSYLQPKGHILYATCSILPQENEQQIAHFQEKFGLELVTPPFRSLPQQDGMDGFFGAMLKKG
jgi:16S rRNA (cytosine967-C5)-methyltransferase